MSDVQANWYGDEQFRFVQKAGWEGIVRAAVAFWSALQETLNAKVNPPPYKNSSKPGEAPAKRTGFLAANTIYELDEPNMEVRVGVRRNAIYGLFLEAGTRFLAARPWFMATLKREWSRLQQLAGGGGQP